MIDDETLRVLDFQSWLFKKRYFGVDANGLHVQTAEHATIGPPVKKTTLQLYTEFKIK